MLKSLIFLFLILFLILMPVTAEEKPLDIGIEFQEFYEGNFSGVKTKVIGTVGIPYQGNVVVRYPNEEVNLANRSLELKFSYKDIPESEISEQKTTDREIFWYNERYYSYEFNDTFDLSEKLGEKLSKGESNFSFDIAFLEAGMYKITYKEQSEKDSICSINSIFISIVEPIEWVKLTKQSQLLDAEKKSAEASEKSAKYSKCGATVAAVLAGFTLLIVVVSYRTLKQIQKDREVDLLRRRLGNLYSMLKYNKDILNQKLPFTVACFHPKYNQWIDFYTKFRKSLYLGSDDLVDISQKFLEYIDQNKVPQEKEEEFKEIREKLIKQIDSDYDKYLKKLLKLTKKPKK